MTEQTCSRCGKTILDPITSNANYVVHDDFVEEEDKEVHYALKHNIDTIHATAIAQRETERDFDALAAEMAHPEADEKRVVTVGTERQENEDGTFVETAKKKEIEFSVPEDWYDEEEADTPERIKDDDVALVKTTTEKRPVQKTAIVCRNCTKDDDEIIWGADE